LRLVIGGDRELQLGDDDLDPLDLFAVVADRPEQVGSRIGAAAFSLPERLQRLGDLVRAARRVE
jgi:hypothetical protein